MTSSREDDPERKVVSLLEQIRSNLSNSPLDESPEERADRFEFVLERVADVLTLYGANVFTLAVNQVQLLKHLSDIEDMMREKSNKMPQLPYFRSRTSQDDTSN